MQAATRIPGVEDDLRFYVHRLLPVPPKEEEQQQLAARLSETRRHYAQLVLEQPLALRDVIKLLGHIEDGIRAPFRFLDGAKLTAEEKKRRIASVSRIRSKIQSELERIRGDAKESSTALARARKHFESLQPKVAVLHWLYSRQVDRERLLCRLAPSRAMDRKRIRTLEEQMLSSSRDFLAQVRATRRARRIYEEAKNELCRRNLRLVVRVAKRHANRGIPLLDLIQEGNTGLLHAVDKFDEARGVRFSTYATHWIRQGISRALENHSRTIRLPSHLSQAYNRYQFQEARFFAAEGRRPTIDEATELFGFSTSTLQDALKAVEAPVSLDEVLHSDDGARLGDLIPDQKEVEPERVDQQLLHRHLDKVLEVLNPRSREAICLRFGLIDGECRSFQEIGQILGVTGERARQIVIRGLDVLRKRCESSTLKKVWTQLTSD